MVVKPIAPPPVATKLLETDPPPFCELTARATHYTGAELSATIDCWRSAWSVAAGKHRKLASAVKIREAKVQEAVKAAVR